jgi:catechol 2,3-dioxygenase
MAIRPGGRAGLAPAAGDAPWAGGAQRHGGRARAPARGRPRRGRRFFADALGFDRVVWRYPGALFLGAGGYHHHLGTNTWAGPGARPAGPDDARLLEWTVELPAAADVAAAAASLAAAGYRADAQPDGSVVAPDPWGTAVRLRAGPG